MVIGAVLQISAYGVAQMIVARVIAGIGNGLNTSTAPVWQSETSKANMRGKLVVVEMVIGKIRSFSDMFPLMVTRCAICKEEFLVILGYSTTNKI